ncbi:WhiB family transcriptional regulator [Pseudoglutamicibacter cumminsii]|uniref:Transcriptional regulator WhiB n=1 Tax=Pseudoglutamicibacter cumminsii TaxID=156979 RepID=A0ABX5LAK7_9MICC|nr:WhiB family transcriptional regulator [Pseudoglutamicibacter cumminsii]PWI27882.1 WhiB family transcriptional regulator [Pseudoglutamicibacter cumminsii]
MAQRDRYELAEGREKRAVVTRDVPGDWFLDPADPEASTRYNSNLDLEEAATALLAAHSPAETSEADTPEALATVTPLHSDVYDVDASDVTDAEQQPSAQTDAASASGLVEAAPNSGARPAEVQKPSSQQFVSLVEFMGMDDEGELGWQTQALCAQTDPEAFFPEKGGSTRDAKKVCGSCAVRAECLEYALKNDERFGIWGGMSERERRRLRKQGA